MADIFDTLESPALHDEVTTTSHVEMMLNPFIEHYRESNKHVMNIIEPQITRSTLRGKIFELYMPLGLARRGELTTQHQPSLVASSQRGVTSAATKTNEKPSQPRAQHIFGQDNRNMTITRGNARGFVKCGNCLKP